MAACSAPTRLAQAASPESGVESTQCGVMKPGPATVLGSNWRGARHCDASAHLRVAVACRRADTDEAAALGDELKALLAKTSLTANGRCYAQYLPVGCPVSARRYAQENS